MFSFILPWKPVPQKQTQFSYVTKRAYDPSAKDRKLIANVVKTEMESHKYHCLTEQIHMSLTFFLPIPKSTPIKIKHQMIQGIIRPSKRPDVDNLGYLVTNALKGICYKDDSQIVSLHLMKMYSHDPCTIIKITLI